MIIGYARVSTKEQNLEAQIEALKAAGCTKVFSEKASGKTKNRPEFKRLQAQLRPKDIVIVTKLDRLARSLSDLVTIMAALKEMGVGFKSLGESIDLTTPAGRMQMGMFAIVAEFERELIVQRTMDGLAHARSRGRIGGRRPALNDLQRVELIERVERGDLSIPKVGEIYGVSRATVNRIMKQHRETSA
jgi:DNA invertase Pin-like site-specific DNA recombinase